MHLQRMSPPFSSLLDLLSLCLSVLSVPLFPPRNSLSSQPSPLPVSHQIHRARFLSLFCESCEGNLEGLSGINLKGKHLSLLLSLALSADWVRSPGTCRLLISTTPVITPTAAQSFCQSLAQWERGKKILFYFLRNAGPILFLCTCERPSNIL